MPDTNAKLNNSTNTRITKLSPLLINQLAAGEVVTRPAAVVKELLENAIDAGATHIEVRITQGGMGMIAVVDNGDGIHPDDMVMAITRHATSKVADIANLQGITTLGFRGEALAAMAAVSRLTLISSHDDSGVGRQLQVAGVLADTPKLLPVVHKRGTTVMVKDLYFNVPARRGNLKSIATEFTHIETIVREVALARADVTLSLFHDDKKRLMLSAAAIGSDDSHLPLSRLEQALGTSLTVNAINIVVDLSSIFQQSIDHAHHPAKISGWLWVNDNQQHPLQKLLYVNGRLVKEVLISNQLRQLANSLELDGIGYALYFQLPHHWLNINVHPSKQRIKISPLNNIMAHLSHTVRLKLKNVNVPANALIEQDDDNVVFPKDTLSTATSQRQQVQAPRQLYKLSAAQQLSKKSPDANTNSSISNSPALNSSIAYNSTLNHNDNSALTILSANKKSTLPQCLEVVSCLPQCQQPPLSSIVNNDDLAPLPWLLFYSQAQCLLINAQDWQSNIALLFESERFDKTEAKNFGFESLEIESSEVEGLELKNPETVTSAAMINQQLDVVTAPLSATEFATFKTSLEQLLNTHAFKVINSGQLLTLMLSSAPS